MAILLGFLAFGWATAQESGTSGSVVPTSQSAKAAIRSERSVRLKGVLISENRRTALVGGRSVREGDRIGGVEIVAIEERGIRILAGAQELNVNVGGTFVPGSSRDKIAPRANANLRHAVKSGETLSAIAFRYRKDGVSMDQMMIALYQSNPQAFSSNINMLHEGAILRIPGENELPRQTPAMAAAETVRHAKSWRPAAPQPVHVADTSIDLTYGPVKSGETLSAIASGVARDGISMNQMMIALYQSNPQAFNGNINRLHEGATLRIPDRSEIGRQTRETATAEVLRQAEMWRADTQKQARSRMEHANIMASADVLLE
jgi:FimV-like protein